MCGYRRELQKRIYQLRKFNLKSSLLAKDFQSMMLLSLFEILTATRAGEKS